MKFIPTSTFTVEQLKKQAKKLQRSKGGKHTDLLNVVAKQANYLHWHHVTLCAQHTANLGPKSLSAECFYLLEKVRRDEEVLTRTGPETTSTVPFILFGYDGDAWLIDATCDAAVYLMKQKETIPIESFTEDHNQIAANWPYKISEISDKYLIVTYGDSDVPEHYAYPEFVLEQLVDLIMWVRNNFADKVVQ